MKVLEIKFRVKDSKSEWSEVHIEQELNNPHESIAKILKDFNSNLRKSESKRSLVEILSSTEIEIYRCSMCGLDSLDPNDFDTDFRIVDENDMTCENCYSEINEDY